MGATFYHLGEIYFYLSNWSSWFGGDCVWFESVCVDEMNKEIKTEQTMVEWTALMKNAVDRGKMNWERVVYLVCGTQSLLVGSNVLD